MTGTIDPITREVVQNRLVSIVREMSVTLQRAAYSPIITEVKDFSSVLLRPDASIVAMAEGIPVFLGSMHQTLGPVLDRYPLHDIRRGDVYISNDPFTANGTHKNDVNILRPIFWSEEPTFFAVTKAHWTDIGAKDPGSWSPDSTNTYQEGVTIPPLRLYRAGVLNDELQEVILASTRLRDNNEGDLLAQLSACNVGDVRVQELLSRYGLEQTNACIDSFFDYAEARVRAEVEKIPDGVYTGQQTVDSDGVSGNPAKVVVQISVSGDNLTIDLSDCEEQRNGSFGNSYRAFTVAACRVAIKCLLAPHLDSNEGFYRPITVTTRRGTMTDPVHPAPGTVADNVITSVIESIFDAFGEIMPDRIMAGIFGGVQAMAIGGQTTDTGAPYIHFMPYAGGWGARQSKDGINALCPLMNGDNDNIPCEIAEAKYPLLVERYELIPDSGGPGRMRGGLGVRIDYRVLSNGANVSAGMARWRFAPRGLSGGGHGARSTLVVNADSESAQERPVIGGTEAGQGCLLSHRCGGGGGFGDPYSRDQESVGSDVVDGYVSAAGAERDYGFRLEEAY